MWCVLVKPLLDRRRLAIWCECAHLQHTHTTNHTHTYTQSNSCKVICFFDLSDESKPSAHSSALNSGPIPKSMEEASLRRRREKTISVWAAKEQHVMRNKYFVWLWLGCGMWKQMWVNGKLHGGGGWWLMVDIWQVGLRWGATAQCHTHCRREWLKWKNICTLEFTRSFLTQSGFSKFSFPFKSIKTTNNIRVQLYQNASSFPSKWVYFD